MKLLILGSKGFIGSAAARLLRLQYQHEVWEADVVVDYANKNYFLIDASNADFQSIFRTEQFDMVVNCSGAAHVGDSLVNPLRDFVLNTFNVFKLLDAIRIFQPSCRLVNLSSAAVYGCPEILPITENHQAAPVSPYGIHKLQTEAVLKEFSTYFNIGTCSLRVFSAYGPGLKKQLFWDIYQKAKTFEVVELFGTGKESRDFIYIDDLIQAINCVIYKSEFNGEVINIANGTEVTVDQAVNTFLSNFPGKKETFFTSSSKAGDPLYWKADISRISSMGYRRTVALEEGLNNYYHWICNL